MNKKNYLLKVDDGYFAASFIGYFRCLVVFGLFCFSSVSSGQNKHKFYLIESTELATLLKSDKLLIDSILTLYHQEKRDSVRLELLDFLSNNCSGNVWVKYNDLIYEYSSDLLKGHKKFSSGQIQHLRGIRANSQANKGVYLKSIGDYSGALVCYKNAITGFEEVGDINGAATVTHNIGNLYIIQDRIDLGLDYLLKNISNFKKLNDPIRLASTYNSIAAVYSENGQIKKSLYYLHEALKLMEPGKENKVFCIILNTLGSAYHTNVQIDEALKYYKRAYEMAKKIAYKEGESKSLESIGQLMSTKGEYKEADKYLKESLKMDKEMNNKYGIALTTSAIGVNLTNMGNYSAAEEAYKESIRLFKELKKPKGISNTSKSLARLYLKRGDVDKAEAYGLLALQTAQKIQFPENIEFAADLLKDVYIRKANWKKALEMSELWMAMRDSIKNKSVSNELLKRDYEYEYRKTKLADSLNFAKKAEVRDLLISEQHAQLRAEKTQRISLIVFLVLFIALGIILYKAYSNKQRDNKIILSQKSEVEKKNSENELLLGEIHHRVKNNLQVISSLLSLQERSMESESAKSAIHEGKERVKSMELVHKMLYQRNSFSGIEMNAYVNKLSLGLIESFGMDEKDVELNAGFRPITLDVDTAIPLGLILNELIINSLKHAKSATEKLALKIEIQETETKQLQVSIADNGKGKASEIEASDSFGLKIIRALVRQLDGVMVVKEDGGINYVIALNNYKLIG